AGDPVAVDGDRLSPAALLTRLNEIGGRHGIGRLDLVENRFVGMKSRGVYETPGGTILHAAHRGIESLCLDRGAMHLKDELMPRSGELIYDGLWLSRERDMLQALIDKSQAKVEGRVRLKLYKGLAHHIGQQPQQPPPPCVAWSPPPLSGGGADCCQFVRLCSSSQPSMIWLKASGASTLGKCFMPAISS